MNPDRRQNARRALVVPLLTLVFAVVSRLAASPLARMSRESLLLTVFPIREQPTRSATIASLAASPVASRTIPRRAIRLLVPTPRRLLAAGAALVGGILVATSLAAGSYAFLNAQVTTPAVTIKSGNLALTVQYGSGAAGTTATLPTTAWATMLPGDVVGQQFTIASTGSAGSTITARLMATTAWDIRVAAGTCPTAQLPTAALTTTAQAAGSLAGGASSTVCVQATLPAGAAAGVSGTTAGFTIILDSTQVPS